MLHFRLFGGEAVFVWRKRSRDVVVFTLGSLEEDLEKAEDGGKSWSCEGQEERVL